MSNDRRQPDVHPELLLAREAALSELNSQRSKPQVKEVGPVEPHPTDDGLFRVRYPKVDLSQHVEAALFIASSPKSKARVQTTVVRSTRIEVVVRPAKPVTNHDRHKLYVAATDTFIAEKVSEYLDELEDPGLGGAMFPDGELSPGSQGQIPGLNEGQDAAAGLIIAKGAHAIWGPPGTGKTRVIAEVIAQLLKTNATVCLASNANVAVDHALLSAAKVADVNQPGVIIRVGNPGAELKEHDFLSLEKATEACTAQTTRQIANAKAQLAELTTSAEFTFFTAYAPHSGLSRADLETASRVFGERLPREEMAALDRAGEEATDHLQQGITHLDELIKEHGDLRVVHQALERLRQEENLRRAERDLATTDLKALSSGAFAKIVNRKKKARAARELSACDERIAELTSLQAPLVKQLGDAEQAGVSPSTIANAQTARDEYQVIVDRARAAYRAVQEVEHLWTALTSPQQAAAEFVQCHGGSTECLNRFKRITASNLLPAVERLETQVRSLEDQRDREASQVIDNAQVIGTTLAQLFVNRKLSQRTFDYIIIDEAGAALPPIVLAAMSKATKSATVVGDFEQTGPIASTPEKETRKKPPWGHWVTKNPFDLMRVGTGEQCRTSVGCAALRIQYRYGPLTMAIANEAIYDGLLQHPEGGPPASNGDPEIVVVDTHDLATELGGLNLGRRSWNIGAALSAQIASQYPHNDVGVVTPYSDQRRLTRIVLDEAGLNEVAVGTVHAFQGREFPVVLFDLVESGPGDSWVAKAERSKNDFIRNGLRVFNVAITRNQGTLIIITDAPQLQRAQGPLSSIGRRVESGEIPVAAARDILRPQDSTQPLYLPTPRSAPLDKSHRVAIPTVLNGHEFDDQFHLDLESANHKVTIYSPWVTHPRIDKFSPALTNAAARSVAMYVHTKEVDDLWHPEAVARLEELGVTTHQHKGMHEKVVLIDDAVTYIGSLNTLSWTERTSEIMIRFHGPKMNQLMTQNLKAHLS